MQIFSFRSRTIIDISVGDFGTDTDKHIWQEWCSSNQVKPRQYKDLVDDGSGPMPVNLRETILTCLQKRYEFLRSSIRSPIITRDEVVDIDGRMSSIYSLARWINSGNLNWSETI